MDNLRAGYSELLEDEIKQHVIVAEASLSLRQEFDALVRACLTALSAGGKILLFGNGGSAADAQHIAAELVARFRFNRRALPAIALTTDTSILTAVGNDFGFDQIFARQVEALALPGDVCIGVSTSGNSENVWRALSAARSCGCVAVGFTGAGGGRLAQTVDILVAAPSEVTARIQEVHILLGHALCAAIEHDVLAREQ